MASTGSDWTWSTWSRARTCMPRTGPTHLYISRKRRTTSTPPTSDGRVNRSLPATTSRWRCPPVPVQPAIRNRCRCLTAAPWASISRRGTSRYRRPAAWASPTLAVPSTSTTTTTAPRRPPAISSSALAGGAPTSTSASRPAPEPRTTCIETRRATATSSAPTPTASLSATPQSGLTDRGSLSSMRTWFLAGPP